MVTKNGGPALGEPLSNNTKIDPDEIELANTLTHAVAVVNNEQELWIRDIVTKMNNGAGSENGGSRERRGT